MSGFYNNGINYTHIQSVTKSDSTELKIRAFMVGVAGDVAVQTGSMDAAVTIPGCLVGVVYPVAGNAVKIMSTNTTATGIIGLR